MIEQGVWSKEKEDELKELGEKIHDGEKRLSTGGIKLAEARKIAIDMRINRIKRTELLSELGQNDSNTLEGQSENAKFNFLASRCIISEETGKPVYKDTDDYLLHGSDDVALKGAELFAEMQYGLNRNYEKQLPENKFLQKWNFVNDELRLVNKDGKLIDIDGRLIDDNGRYIDENNNFVDIDGNPLDKDGNYLGEHKPFLDDDGNEIIEAKNEEVNKVEEPVVPQEVVPQEVAPKEVKENGQKEV